MNINPKLGVITVTYNSAAVITDFLKTCLGQSYHNFTLYIIDNASTDKTLKLVEQYKDSRVEVIQQTLNLGFAKGCNLGIGQALKANCELICLINNDTLLEPELFSQLIKDMRNTQADFIAPKIMYYQPSNVIWWAGGYFKKNRYYANMHRGMYEVDQGQYDQIAPQEFASFCCVILTKRCFEINGFLDENFFVYWEDADWCLNALRKGLKLIYTPQVKLFHKESSLTIKTSDFTLKHIIRGKFYYIRKNFSRFTCSKFIIIIFLQYFKNVPKHSFIDNYKRLKYNILGWLNLL
jgi:GT2 family glycosyltransferase